MSVNETATDDALAPGLYEIPAEEYHALRDHLSAGIARILLDQSPAHARYAIDHPDEDDATKASDRGTVAHALLFEGRDCALKLPFADWRTNAAKEARAQTREAGKIPVLEKDYPAIMNMVAAAEVAWRRSPDLEGYRPPDGKAEQAVIWNDHGIDCRCRPDWLAHDGRLIIDGKFTEAHCAPERMAAQIINQAFDQRAAFYTRGVQATMRVQPKYVYLFQEVKPPYCTALVGIPPAMLELGMRKAEHAMTVWENCRATGEWPGYTDRIAWAEPPEWAINQWGFR